MVEPISATAVSAAATASTATGATAGASSAVAAAASTATAATTATTAAAAPAAATGTAILAPSAHIAASSSAAAVSTTAASPVGIAHFFEPAMLHVIRAGPTPAGTTAPLAPSPAAAGTTAPLAPSPAALATAAAPLAIQLNQVAAAPQNAGGSATARATATTPVRAPTQPGAKPPKPQTTLRYGTQLRAGGQSRPQAPTEPGAKPPKPQTTLRYGTQLRAGGESRSHPISKEPKPTTPTNAGRARTAPADRPVVQRHYPGSQAWKRIGIPPGVGKYVEVFDALFSIKTWENVSLSADWHEIVSEEFQKDGYTEEEADKLADDYLRSAGNIQLPIGLGRGFFKRKGTGRRSRDRESQSRTVDPSTNNARAKRPLSWPSPKKVKLDEHVDHFEGAERMRQSSEAGGSKTIIPGVSRKSFERMVREAYKNMDNKFNPMRQPPKRGTGDPRVLHDKITIQGRDKSGRYVLEMIFNITTSTIESAYPVPRDW
jgi:hypothetical protein